jgi:hypothetical protein
MNFLRWCWLLTCFLWELVTYREDDPELDDDE